MDFDPCLFGVSKDDIGRCMSKDSYYACNTESECNILSSDPHIRVKSNNLGLRHF